MLPAPLCCKAALVALILLVGFFAAGKARAEIVLVDAMKREVRLDAPARRIVTNESLLLYSLALIDPDPISKIAGWAAPRRIDAGVYKSFERRFPSIRTIPEVSSVMPATVSIEAVLSVEPDLFVVSLWQPEWQEIAERMTAAGLPVIFLDGPESVQRTPAEATAFSLQLLGTAIGRKEQAWDYADFVRSKYNAIAERLANVAGRPKVVMDVHAGTLCCYTPGSGNRITQYIDFARGHSIGADVVSGYDGQLSPEFVLAENPFIYVGTGSPHLAAQGGLALGGGIDPETARRSLIDVTSRNHLQSLSAVHEGRAYAVSHQLAISALSIVTVECIAKWLHPQALAAIDPDRTLAEINTRFLAAPLDGTFCVGLEPSAP